MKFRTEINIPESEDKFSAKTKFFMTGSCFTDNIGERLQKYKFTCTSNPVGIYYNPISISKLLTTYINSTSYDFSSDCWHTNGIVSHRDFHSINNAINIRNYVSRIQEKLAATKQAFQSAQVIILTLGTAWIYQEKISGKYVANCHKRPSKEFIRSLLSVQDIIAALSPLARLHSEKHFILTVSPVRHLKDGLVDNTRSKSRLIESCHHLVDHFPNTSYFPAYEIMMDDLRDYRYYAEDMIHPSAAAIDYIWDKWVKTHFDLLAQGMMLELDKLFQALAHRPFHPESPSYQSFCKKHIDIATQLEQSYNISLKQEKEFFRKRM